MPTLPRPLFAGLLAGLIPLCLATPARLAAAEPPPWEAFSALPVWEDGLSEMCYYDAVEQHYGQPRRFTRVHLLNRQWMGRASGVKASPHDADAVAVFKLNIAEEIPTENYNYRYLTTLFLHRPELEPFKLATSSQEWCGTTFKRARWGDDRLQIDSFSYFGGEGDASWAFEGDAVPREAVFVLARAAVAAGQPKSSPMLTALRGHHGPRPDLRPVRLVPGDAVQARRVPAGRFQVRRVEVLEGDRAAGWLDVEASAPYRLVAFAVDGVSGELRFSERRAYWERGWGSGFHPSGMAP